MVTRIPLRRNEDERGWFMELMRASALPKPVRQANLASSRKGVNVTSSRAGAGTPSTSHTASAARVFSSWALACRVSLRVVFPAFSNICVRSYWACSSSTSLRVTSICSPDAA